MTGKKSLALAVVAGALLCIAAASVSYILWPAVIDQGGGVAYSSSYEMRGSVGGPVIVGAAEPGVASSTNYGFEVNTVAVLETGAKEEPPPGNGGGGGGCGAGAALVFSIALSLGRTRGRE